MFDHAAAAAQIAGNVAYATPATVSWTPPGGGPALSLPALFQAAPPEETGYDRNPGDSQAVQVSIARSLFGATFPRQGQVFTGGGRSFRIVAEPPDPLHPLAVFRCVAV